MSRYSGISLTKNEQGITYYKNVIYPEVPYDEDDLYVMTHNWERLDNLAYRFYGDPHDYWIISIANSSIINFGSLYVPKGSQIRIPLNINKIKHEFSILNR